MSPAFEPSTADRPAAIARWERNRARGRATFVWRQGVVGWGLPAALLAIGYKFVQEHGFVWSTEISPGLRTGIALAIVVFPFCGYLLGGRLWEVGEANYERMLEQERRERGSRTRG